MRLFIPMGFPCRLRIIEDYRAFPLALHSGEVRLYTKSEWLTTSLLS